MRAIRNRVMNDFAAEQSIPQGLRCVRENFGRPSGTLVSCSAFPGAEAPGYYRDAPPGLRSEVVTLLI